MLKNSIRLQSEKVCSSGKLKRTMGTSTGHGTILENIKISALERLGYCESNHHKLWFDKECSQLVD
jgi:hypothetical protein